MAQPLFLCSRGRFERLRKDGVDVDLIGGVFDGVACDDGLGAMLEQEGRGVIGEDGVNAHAVRSGSSCAS